MNTKLSKIGAVVLAVFLLGTAFFVPVSSVNVEQTQKIDNGNMGTGDGDPEEDDLDPFYLDRSYTIDPTAPLNRDDNDDAGYKRDAGDQISRSNAIYPGEPVDDWPGRGNTGKLSSSDDEDWYFFSVCEGQEIDIEMTPPSGFNFDIGLWDDDENLEASSSNSGSATESLTYTADYTGKFYFQILYVSGTGEGQYSFDVTLNGQNDAGTGNDAGDNFAGATSISPGIYTGYLDMNDEEDWYKFNANSGQGIHFTLDMKKVAYLSDFDIYLYNPSENLVHYEAMYYDDELLYPADASGQWRVKIDIFPGWTDIPQPTQWDYWTYGSGAYEFEFALEGSAPSPPGPITQPDIIPVAHTFNIVNSPGSNVDEYGYLASIPACNYLDGGDRYLAPIVYNYDSTPTEWYGDVDDTTGYLLDDWDDYLASEGKTAVDYYVNSVPVNAAAEIATAAWGSSNLAVVAIDGSVYEDTTTEVLHTTKTLPRNTEVQTIPNDSPDFITLGGLNVIPMTFINNKWGAITLEIDGSNEEPFLMGVFPHYMTLTTDWWPGHVDEKTDAYYPLTVTGLSSVWAAGVSSVSDDWDLKITKLECDRYTINVDDSDSVLTAEITTSTPSDLLVFLVDPDGNLKAPDIPDWNGGPISPIHGWNGMDNPAIPPDCDDWRAWEPDDHTYFSAEVLHPEVGEWTAIVVPRYAQSGSGVQYTISGKIRELNSKRVDAAISAANAAVIASQEHVPLLYVTEDSVPTETQDAFNDLGISEVIFVQRGNIGSGVESSLPTLEANLKTMQNIVDYIKDYTHSENYITITSLKTGEGFFAPSAMLAAYHCSPVLRIGEIPGNPAAMANKIDSWRLWEGDYYHGNRAPGHLPVYDEPVDPMTPAQLLLAILDYLGGGSSELPPWGLDAKRYWNAELHDEIHSYIDSLGLDEAGKEAYAFVAPRKDIRVEAHAVMIGTNSYAGHIPGDTPAYTSSIIVKNILYPALIYANINRNVTTMQLMNYPDGGQWTTNDGERYSVYSSRVLKNAFMSHGRTFDGHILWDAHLERMNDGVSVMYYSGHGTGGSGMSAQYFQTDNCNYPEQEWYDAWRGYMYDSWKTPRDNGRRWYNPEPANLYDFIHYKWHDQLFDNLKNAAVFYMSCSTGQQFGPMVYLDHGAVIWYGNAGSGLCPQADLLDDWFFEDAMINGLSVGEAYSKYVWLHHRDFTIPEGDPNFEESMYGPSSLYAWETHGGITTVHCIYGDPELILYSPEWSSPNPIDSVITGSNNQQPLAPTIDGPTSGTPETSYTYNFVTTDPNDDDIYYYVDWGDGETEDWDGPYNSGDGSSASHTWSSQGIYTVKVKARDSYGAEGPWGTLKVNMPRARSNVFIQFLERILEPFPILKLILTKLLDLN
ncbi:MAG: PKD domain-containing protein [Thermoplasmatales archaeon]|nr:PKD domain-containing protein [Thermoplasmatales archaeon]